VGRVARKTKKWKNTIRSTRAQEKYKKIGMALVDPVCIQVDSTLFDVVQVFNS
jgi:hypothetical protein